MFYVKSLLTIYLKPIVDSQVRFFNPRIGNVRGYYEESLLHQIKRTNRRAIT